MMYVFFGLPGVGKTYAGRILQKYFDFHLFEGDQAIPRSMLHALENSEKVSAAMRDDFFQKLIAKIQQHSKIHPKLVVTQTFIKEKYRKQLLAILPQAQFILITSKNSVRKKRLAKRKEFPISKNYANQMVASFDRPQIPHKTIDNTPEGEDYLKNELGQLVDNFSAHKSQ